MNLLIISQQFGLKNSTGSLRMKAFYRYLKEYEINPYVITYDSNINEGSIVNVKDPFGSNSNPLMYYGWRVLFRFLAYFGFGFTSYHFWKKNAFQSAEAIINERKISAILASYPSIENLELGLELNAKYKIPLITDFRDGLIFEPIAADMLKRTPYFKKFTYIEKMCLLNSSAIISVTEPISEYFINQSPSGLVATLSNGYDFSDLEEFPVIELGQKINIVHTGGISASQPNRISTLKKIIDALECKEDDVKEILSKICIHFVGYLTSNEIKMLRGLVNLGLVKIHGHQSRAYSVACQQAADVLLLIAPAHMKSVATGKVFEYIAARKPILTVALGTTAEKIASEAGLAVVINEDDAMQMREKIKAVADKKINVNPNEDFIASCSREGQTAILASIIKKL